MKSSLSRKWNPATHREIKRFLSKCVAIGKRQIRSITNGLTMPEIVRLPIGSAKRMDAAVLFFDLEDFTRISSDLPNELTLRVLNIIIPSIMRIVRMWNGEVEKNTGDGIMAIFGTETRDSSLIARDTIECAMAVRYFMRNEIRTTLVTEGLPIMRFRIGADMQQLLIARIGIHSVNFLAAVGAAANRASKLQSLAQSDGICIGENLFNTIPEELTHHCLAREHPSWKWQNPQGRPYRFFDCTADWPEPKEWIRRRFMGAIYF